MRRMTNLALAMACVCSIGVALAHARGPACCSGDKAKKMAKAGSCGTTEGFPTMAMMVSGKSYDCSMTAAKAAKEAKTGIVFQVADQKFDSKDKAMAALADASEQYVENYMSVACVADGKVMRCNDKASACTEKGAKAEMTSAKSKGSACCKDGAKTAAAKSDGSCSKEGAKAKAVAMTKEEIEACCKNAKEVKYMVVGRTFKTRDEAMKARDKTLDSVKTIAMTYEVDGKEVKCSTEVCPKAKADGKVKYMVNKDKMECEIEARIALAKAKFEAASDFAEKLAKI